MSNQVMINLRSGITHLPLYFHSGRALEFQSKLQEVRRASQPSCSHLASCTPLQKNLAPSFVSTRLRASGWVDFVWWACGNSMLH